MKRRFALFFVLALALASLSPGRASADTGSATYAHFVGSEPLCGLAPTACPDIAMADSGDTIEADGLLTVTCELGDKIRAGAMEGVRLNVQRLINFNHEVSGSTVFVLLT